MCPYKRKTGRIGRRRILVFDMCVFTHVMLAIPCKSHSGGFASSGCHRAAVQNSWCRIRHKGNGRRSEKTKNCQGSPMENHDSLLFELD